MQYRRLDGANLNPMEYFSFTLFNSITLLILTMTLVLVWRRAAGALASDWPIAVHATIVAYAYLFPGGLNLYWVAAGAVCGLVIRIGFYPATLRLVEAVPLGYVAWRCVGLVLLW